MLPLLILCFASVNVCFASVNVYSASLNIHSPTLNIKFVALKVFPDHAMAVSLSQDTENVDTDRFFSRVSAESGLKIYPET